MEKIENEEMVSYLKKELEAYEKVLYLIKEQRKAIKSANTHKLNSLINEKECFINNIKKMKNHNIKLNEQIALKSEITTSDNRIVTLLGKIKSVITEALNHNRKNMELISSEINTVKTRNGNLSKKRKMAGALKMQQFRTPRFVDLMS